MNQVFDLNRWLLLTGKHWSENRKRYLLSMAAIAGLIIIWYAFMAMVEPNEPLPGEIQVGTFYGGLYVAGCLYASLIFSDLSSTPRAINYLSVPASAFEKLLVALLFGLILFFVCYTVIFYLVNIPMVNITDSWRYNHWMKVHVAGDVFNPQKIANVFVIDRYEGNYTGENFYVYFILIYIASQSAFILGSVYFPSYSFIKTAITISVIILFSVFFMTQVARWLLPAGAHFASFTGYVLRNADDSVRIVKLPDWIGSVLFFLLKYSLGPVLWIATYFRLKEKEV